MNKPASEKLHRTVQNSPRRTNPAFWIALWLIYSLTMLGYLAHLDAQRGIFCMSI